MCGLVGYYSPNLTGDIKGIADSMLEAISHRGFDNRGIESYQLQDGSSLCLGHNRLSIIGLSNLAHQPLSYKHLHISYNGEIYNYKELKDELIGFGYEFSSQSDTEVILKVFDRYGTEGVSKLNGMFAIALYDSREEKLYLVRDRLGVKPLFYFHNGKDIVFGSEVKAVLKHPRVKKEYDPEIIGNYLTYGYVNSFKSIYSGIKKLENGTIFTYDLNNGTQNTTTYWSLNNKGNSYINDYNKAYKAFDELIESSISYRLIADVPVGLFLSSGLDSNLILNTYLNKTNDDITTYSLKSLDFDEENIIGSDPRVKRNYLTLEKGEKWSIFKSLCKNYSEPLSDPATIGLYKLSEEAAKSLKVIMVGDGGDEILGGYNSYKLYLKYSDKYSLFKFLYKAVSPIVSSILSNNIEIPKYSRPALLHSILAGKNLIDIQQQRKHLQQKFMYELTNFNYNIPAENVPFNKITDFLNYKTKSELVHQLNYKTDIAGMLHTVEIREPLLDYRLFDLQQKISDDLFRKMMLEDKSKKIILDIMRLKFKIDTAKMSKMGFHLNYPEILFNNDELNDILGSYQSSFLEKKVIINIWESFKKHKVEPALMFRIITYVMWDYLQD